jgi:hypothetical protein
MADVNGYATYALAATVGVTTVSTGTGFCTVQPTNGFNARLTPGITYEYQMSGTDAVTAVTTTWLVQGAPDFAATTTAATAAIALAGLTTPVRNVCIVGQWPVPN